jgi:hypothetical protein
MALHDDLLDEALACLEEPTPRYEISFDKIESEMFHVTNQKSKTLEGVYVGVSEEELYPVYTFSYEDCGASAGGPLTISAGGSVSVYGHHSLSSGCDVSYDDKPVTYPRDVAALLNAIDDLEDSLTDLKTEITALQRGRKVHTAIDALMVRAERIAACVTEISCEVDQAAQDIADLTEEIVRAEPKQLSMFSTRTGRLQANANGDVFPANRQPVKSTSLRGISMDHVGLDEACDMGYMDDDEIDALFDDLPF